ncbi:MAG: hypothetical protein U9Q07_04225 [Planctomycetota bacterium]|nr:hypothetical protein [Planctomycetota bacterium]
MGNELFEVASIAMGSGDLISVTNFEITTTVNVKQVSTLRQKGAGTFKGEETTTVTFDCAIGENGEEADWIALVKQRQFKALRAKVPNRTMTINGEYGEVKITSTLDDKITYSLSFVGHMDD